MFRVIFIGLIVLITSGCAYSPLNAAVNVAKWDGHVADPNLIPTKRGEACAHSVLGVVAFGDATIEAAKINGNISRVATVDHQTTNILYFYGGYCTIVYGN